MWHTSDQTYFTTEERVIYYMFLYPTASVTAYCAEYCDHNKASYLLNMRFVHNIYVTNKYKCITRECIVILINNIWL